MSSLIPVIAALVMLQPEPAQADVVWVASGEFCEPETVLPLPDNTLLISNVCGFGESKNGFLTLLDPKGNVLDWRIVEDLDAPLGMALMDERLYVVDNNRVKIFSWPQYRPLQTIDLDATVANDIAVGGDGTLYVSDTARNQVIEIKVDGLQSVLTGKPQFQGANGIHVNGKALFVGGSRLWRVDLQNHSVTTIGPEWIADIDGIEMEPSGVLQITLVSGPLIRYCNCNRFEILGGKGISSANHGYAANLGLALIPTGFDNTVIAISINESKLKQASHPKSTQTCLLESTNEN